MLLHLSLTGTTSAAQLLRQSRLPAILATYIIDETEVTACDNYD